ncbi:MAG TPA: DUF429 domain-containing protein [Oscillatoriales cyanobacterium M59_W2019_021]|nr:DUF429 domain-containing protein [Oscillatoriales cyanobacterium M59_W2019_021]
MDGCRGGWLAVMWSDRGFLDARILRDRSSLIAILTDSARTFIDIPIGLPDSEASRDCDREATPQEYRQLRKILGRSFSSSVFNPPIRSAICASSYSEASAINAAKTGKKLSIQAWNIVPKIREIDELLLKVPTLHDRCFESYPELLFYHLNSQHPLNFKKKTREGKQERLELLQSQIPEIQVHFAAIRDRHLKKDASDDDILDAMVLAYFAHRSLTASLHSIPNPPNYDQKGLRMAIHWC